jgi:uncharacterized RDD family membrane protein YckC
MDDRQGPPEPPLPPPGPPGPGPVQRLPRVTVVNETVAVPIATPPLVYVPKFGSLDTYFAGRLAAFIIDVFAIAFLIATFLFNLVFAHLTSSTSAAPLLAFGISLVAVKNAFQGSFIVLALGSFIGAFAFIWICETIFGTTLGKLLFGLAIRRAAGGRAGPVRVFFRNLFRPIDALVVGGFLALVTPKHQRIGDFAGGTIVVRSPLGPVASVLSACALIALGYAQIMYGGGVASAAGVLAQTAIAVPHVFSRLGGAAADPRASALPTALPTAAPASPQPTAAPPTPQPTAAPTDQTTPAPQNESTP